MHTHILRQKPVFENTGFCVFCTKLRLLHVGFVQQPLFV
nr:MAG TPA: hypothetical protein [Caudoviricetes sp.]